MDTERLANLLSQIRQIAASDTQPDQPDVDTELHLQHTINRMGHLVWKALNELTEVANEIAKLESENAEMRAALNELPIWGGADNCGNEFCTYCHCLDTRDHDDDCFWVKFGRVEA